MFRINRVIEASADPVKRFAAIDPREIFQEIVEHDLEIA